MQLCCRDWGSGHQITVALRRSAGFDPQAMEAAAASAKGSLTRSRVARPFRDASRSSRMKTWAVMNASPPAVWRSCGMTSNISHSASSVNRRIGGRPANAPSPRVQRQVHRVEAAIEQRHAPVPLVAGVERRDVMADVVSDDDAVAEIVEEPFERLGFSMPAAALVARDTVDRHRLRVALDLEQRRGRIVSRISRPGRPPRRS